MAAEKIVTAVQLGSSHAFRSTSSKLPPPDSNLTNFIIASQLLALPSNINTGSAVLTVPDESIVSHQRFSAGHSSDDRNCMVYLPMGPSAML